MSSALPSGVFFQSYADERALLRTWPQRLWMITFLLAMVALPWAANDYLLGVLTLAGVTLVAVLGLHITIGMAGQLNLGQSAFVGVGAFVAAALASKGWSMWVCIPAAAFASGAVSILFGLPAVRIKGFYLALTTIAAQIMFPVVMIRLPDHWFGGTAGLPVDPPLVFGVAADTPRSIYWLVLAVVVLAFLAAANLGNSRIGRAFRAMHDNDIASSVIGVDLARTKILAFFAGAFYAGISGALYAYYVRYVSTDQFTLWLSVWYVGMLIVGGLHTPLGAVLGVVAITLLHEGVHAMGSVVLASLSGISNVSGGTVFAMTNVVLGGVIVLMLLFEPLGLARRWALVKAAYRIWPYPRG
jgi:branched-chain amino acid transport system permease protein